MSLGSMVLTLSKDKDKPEGISCTFFFVKELSSQGLRRRMEIMSNGEQLTSAIGLDWYFLF